MYDSHCHLHDARFTDADGAMQRARAAGVSGVLLAGVDPAGWRDGDALAERHADVAVSVGVHPQIVAGLDDEGADAMLSALALRLCDRTRPRVVALGEIGLDAVGERKASMALQQRVFRAQLELAREHDLPVLLHVLRAHGPALSLLEREGVPRRGGVVHSYSGDPDLVRRYVRLGLHLSCAGSVTHPGSRRAREAARLVPAERLLVETDAPDQTPEARRPAMNEPAYLIDIVEALAALRGEEPAALAAYTARNARTLLGLQ